MLFLLDYEPEFDFITQDSIIAKQQLDKESRQHSYIILCERDFYNANGELKKRKDFPSIYATAIPIGSIQFTSSFLKIFHNIEREPALEVPEAIRMERFLKRDYQIVSKQQFPKTGCYFIKDVSEQRSFSYIGEVSALAEADISPIISSHYYQVSELVDIISEFRVYIIRGIIKNIVNYSGDPTVFPDIELIREVVKTYNASQNPIKSYSIDFMVNARGTSIIEMHSFLSLGLYWTKWDSSLLQGYIDGLEYIIQNAGN